MKPIKTHNLMKYMKNVILFSALTATVSPVMAEKARNVQEMYISRGEHSVILDTVARMHESIYLHLKNLQEDKQNRIKAELLAERGPDCAQLGYKPGQSCE